MSKDWLSMIWLFLTKLNHRRLCQTRSSPKLHQAMDILDHEASEDEAARKDMPLNRLSSHEANVELIDKEKRYRSILSQAHSSDEIVRQKWDDWEANIVELTWSEVGWIGFYKPFFLFGCLLVVQEELEASIPPSALSTATMQGQQTQTHSRALRVLIEQLDDLHRTLNQLVKRAQSLVDADDIRARITKVSSGFERFAQVEPAMFEDVLDEELSKYDKFLREIGEVEQKQKSLLSDIQVQNISDTAASQKFIQMLEP
jgi:programmed cell death 6-interacting protein